MVFKFSAKLVKNIKLNIKFLLTSLTFSKIVPKAATNFCFGFPSLSLVDFLQCAFLTRFQNHFQDPRRLQSHMRLLESRSKLFVKVTGRIWTILIGFIGATRNFILNVLHKKTAKTVKALSTYTKKYCFKFKDLHKNTHLLTLSL
jgi:hypothetical protein